jgi:hypothetical protein
MYRKSPETGLAASIRGGVRGVYPGNWSIAGL